MGRTSRTDAPSFAQQAVCVEDHQIHWRSGVIDGRPPLGPRSRPSPPADANQPRLPATGCLSRLLRETFIMCGFESGPGQQQERAGHVELDIIGAHPPRHGLLPAITRYLLDRYSAGNCRQRRIDRGLRQPVPANCRAGLHARPTPVLPQVSCGPGRRPGRKPRMITRRRTGVVLSPLSSGLLSTISSRLWITANPTCRLLRCTPVSRPCGGRAFCNWPYRWCVQPVVDVRSWTGCS